VEVRIYTDNRAAARGMRRRARAIVAGAGIAVVSIVSVLLALIATGHAPGGRHEPAPRQPRLIRMTLIDAGLDPSVVLLEPGAVRFEVDNEGTGLRRFVIQGPGTFAHTDDLAPGASASLDVSLTETGRYHLQAVSPSGSVLTAGMLEVHQ
jgi:hypothetical protein